MDPAILVRRGHVVDAAQERHVVAEAGDAGQGLGAEGGAVIAVAQGQEIDVAGVGTGHQQGQIGRLGAAVGEVHDPVMAGRHGRRQLLGQMGRHRVVEHGGAVLQGLGLLLDRRDHAWVGVADRDAEVHAQEVQVAVAFFVPQILAFAALEDQRGLVGHEGALGGGVVLLAPGDDRLGRPVDGRCHGVLL